VLDLAWSGDSQRLLGCGDGSQVYGKVIMWDSGNSVGEISGHAKKVNSCAFKSSRPFRLVTGGEDNKVNFYEGPPFKYKATVKTHERFVNMVRFSPDGARFFSVSSDMFVAVYDGKDGSLTLEKKVHGGSIFGAMWSADSSQIVTCSGDGTSKVLDASTLEEVAVLNFKSGDRKKTVEEQQVGCLWTAGGILSLSLGGKLACYEAATDAAPKSVQYGHNKPIQGIALKDGKLLAASFADGTGTLTGQLLQWDIGEATASSYEGDMHTNMVMAVASTKEGVITCGMDDSVGFGADGQITTKVPLPSQPKGFACGTDLAAVVTVKDTLVTISVSKKAIVAELPKLSFSPTCVAVAANDSLCAVGGEDNVVHVLGADGKEMYALAQHRDSISACAFSPQCDKLATGCANKEIVIWSMADGSVLIKGLSGYHQARLSTFAWSPDGATLASGGVDGNIIVWDAAEGKVKHKLARAHVSGAVTGILFLDNAKLISSGMDAAIKTWAV